jgi:leucyl aminopeptidase
MLLFKFLYINLFFSVLAPAKVNLANEFFKTNRLIQLKQEEPGVWMNKTQILQLIKNRQHYLDITDIDTDVISAIDRTAVYSDYIIPKSLSQKNITSKACNNLDMKKAKSFLNQLTSLHSRFFLTETGLQASSMLKSHLTSIIKPYKGVAEIEQVDHIWGQPSFIVRLKGSKKPNHIAIMGAHYDSINQDDPFNGRSPGADDNGTGVITITEILRSLVQMQYNPKRTIEFHFYAAEEWGLLGSLSIAFRYALENRQVISMLNIDMNGYKPDKIDNISIVSDYTNQDLTNLLKLCFKEYSKYSTIDDECGYACSDHASWNLAGFPSAHPSEKEWARGYHTDKDIISDVDFEFLHQFAKASIGLLFEVVEA